jgi:hypothetical protein
MPVRLLNSSVLKWPDGKVAVQNRQDVFAIGYFGSVSGLNGLGKFWNNVLFCGLSWSYISDMNPRPTSVALKVHHCFLSRFCV